MAEFRYIVNQLHVKYIMPARALTSGSQTHSDLTAEYGFYSISMQIVPNPVLKQNQKNCLRFMCFCPLPVLPNVDEIFVPQMPQDL